MTDTERAELIRDATMRLAYAITALANPGGPFLASASNDAEQATMILNRLYADKRAREAA